jgi:hypothetical protein
MPSAFLSVDNTPGGGDPRLLEIKIHYLMNMMQKAGLLLDVDGNPIPDVSDDIRADSDIVQQTFNGEDYYK